MTNAATHNVAQASPKYKSPASIRNEDFPRRMRGLEADAVYEYLDALADQIEAGEAERRGAHEENERLRAENERLQAEVQRMRSELSEVEGAGDRVNGQVVELLSQAQLVAEEMVEDVSRDARERLGQARAQERAILEEAMQTAERTRRDAEALIRWTAPGSPIVDGPGRHSAADASAAAAELEQVRSFARAAQAQMQSIMQTFTTEVGRLGDAPTVTENGLPAAGNGSRNGSPSRDLDGWHIEASQRTPRDFWGTD